MFDVYRDIFNRRGASYHAAMTRFPRARDEEFAHLCELADLRDHDEVVDIPSGGGYLRSHVAQRISLTCVETSSEFASRRPDVPGVTNLLRDLHDTRLPPETFDRVLSLAGLHHVDGRQSFFDEAYRILKPEGVLCIADAAVDSPTARFLDEFVDAHNSMGHRGDYLSNLTRAELGSAGFSVMVDESRRYHWNFASVDAMTNFCTLLFGIDRATPAGVRDGIAEYLGYETTSAGVRMNWQLTFILCKKRNG